MIETHRILPPPAAGGSAAYPEGAGPSCARRHQVLVEWNDTAVVPRPDETMLDLFERRVALAPDSVAVVFERRELTYRDLDRRANHWAHRLVRRGVGPEVLVGIHLRRGADMVAALLGVHKAGGAYVPLDPTFPADRLEFMARDAGLKVVLSDLPKDRSPVYGIPVLSPEGDLVDGAEASPAVRATPENLAYVLYTSGSTGRPKGVQITQRALANFLLSMRERPGLGAADVLVAVTTLSFDIAGLELFLPLVAGGRVVLASREVAMDGALLAELLEDCGATVLQATPVTWKLLLQAGWTGSRRLRMLCGGEALARELARALLERGAELWNVYGPTETTIWSTLARVEPGDGAISIGRPIAVTELFVLDADMQPAPSGTAGDLYLGGEGLARGYLGRPDLTADRFIPHPFSQRPGARLYRTGDLARLAADGRVEFLGRADHQVKVRGFRIELGEIESVLLEHPQIRDAVVVAAAARSGEKRLVAYLVPRDPAPDLRELQELLASRLPEYMRPAALAFLEALPLTPNNKVDRRALPEVAVDGPLAPPAARTPTEEIVLGIWADVLERGAIGPDDDFFALGGQSLLAGQVSARLREVLGVELPPSQVFAHPTPARLAREIETRQRTGAGALPPLTAATRGEHLPASFTQERLWLYDQLQPGSNAFNLGYAFRLAGRLAVAALDASLAEIVRRHEVLRTRIVGDARPLQVIDPPPGRLLVVVDLAGLPAAEREPAARQAVLGVESAPFDLARGPLLRVALVRLAADEHAFCLTIHHIACDGWSLGILIREVMDLYGGFSSGRAPSQPELPVQYGDVAVWQRRRLQGELLASQLAYWRRELGGDHPLATLPTDRPGSCAGGALEEVRRTLSGELLEPLLRLGQEQGATLFMVLLAAVQLLVHRYTGSPRVVVGSMYANRAHADLDGLIGFFANVLPLPTTLSPDWTFRELLERVRDMAMGAYTHQDVPYERILEEVRPDRAAGRNALFQVLLVLQNMPGSTLRLPGIEVSPFELGRSVKRAALDLTVTFVVESGELLAWVEYDSGLFERTTAERLLDHVERVLRDVARDPEQRLGRLPLPAEPERGRVDGLLWLTDAASAGEAGGFEPAQAGLQATQEKAEVIHDQLAARRSKLSEKQLALLKQRLKR